MNDDEMNDDDDLNYQELDPNAPQEEWDDEEGDVKRSLNREERDESKPEPKRSVFTQTESFANAEGELFLYTTGYTVTPSGYSVFVHLYQILHDDVDLVWELEFPSGHRVVFPSLAILEHQGYPFLSFFLPSRMNLRITVTLTFSLPLVAIAGTLSAPSTIGDKNFDFQAGAERVGFVTLIDNEGALHSLSPSKKGKLDPLL